MVSSFLSIVASTAYFSTLSRALSPDVPLQVLPCSYACVLVSLPLKVHHRRNLLPSHTYALPCCNSQYAVGKGIGICPLLALPHFGIRDPFNNILCRFRFCVVVTFFFWKCSPFLCRENLFWIILVNVLASDALTFQLSYYFVPTAVLKKERSGLRD